MTIHSTFGATHIFEIGYHWAATICSSNFREPKIRKMEEKREREKESRISHDYVRVSISIKSNYLLKSIETFRNGGFFPSAYPMKRATNQTI